MAAARLGSHEQLHVKASKRHYDAFLAPLLASVANSRDLGREAGFTEEAAANNLRFRINWPIKVAMFQIADIASNDNGGEVDSGDIGSGTYPVQIGPGIVLGKFYPNRLRMPSEPNPPVRDPDAPDEAMELPGMTIGRVQPFLAPTGASAVIGTPLPAAIAANGRRPQPFLDGQSDGTELEQARIEAPTEP